MIAFLELGGVLGRFKAMTNFQTNCQQFVKETTMQACAPRCRHCAESCRQISKAKV